MMPAPRRNQKSAGASSFVCVISGGREKRMMSLLAGLVLRGAFSIHSPRCWEWRGDGKKCIQQRWKADTQFFEWLVEDI